MENNDIPTRFKATYRGTVIGWYDTAAQAEEAIDAARIEDTNEPIAPWLR